VVHWVVQHLPKKRSQSSFPEHDEPGASPFPERTGPTKTGMHDGGETGSSPELSNMRYRTLSEQLVEMDTPVANVGHAVENIFR